jgi:hypothetical protein
MNSGKGAKRNSAKAVAAAQTPGNPRPFLPSGIGLSHPGAVTKTDAISNKSKRKPAQELDVPGPAALIITRRGDLAGRLAAT